jgi:hypothetical protein
MKLTTTTALLALSAAATANELADIAKVVNKANAGWHAEAPTQFSNFSEVKKLCGTINDNRVFASKTPHTDMHNFPADYYRKSWFASWVW